MTFFLFFYFQECLGEQKGKFNPMFNDKNHSISLMESGNDPNYGGRIIKQKKGK